MSRRVTPASERFARFFEALGPDDCWEWRGARVVTGYGRFQLGGIAKTSYPAHRFAYEVAYGPIAPGLVVRHSCDNRGCVNAAHLVVGTQAQNLADMVERGRDRKARGERAGKAKLTAADVLEIRRRAAAGELNPAIARDYGVHTASVWSIVRRRHWKHVPD